MMRRYCVCACNIEYECKNKERDPRETDLRGRERIGKEYMEVGLYEKKEDRNIIEGKEREGFSER